MNLNEMYDLALNVYKTSGVKERPDKLLAMLLLQDINQFEPLKCSEGEFYSKYKKQIDTKIAKIESDFEFNDGEYVELIEEKGYGITKFEHDKIWFLYAEGFGSMHWALMYQKELTPAQIFEECFCKKNDSIIQEEGPVKKLLPNNKK